MRSLLVLLTVAFSCGAWADRPRTPDERKIVVVLSEQRVYALRSEAIQGPDPGGIRAINQAPKFIWKIEMKLSCSTGRRGLETPVGQTTTRSKIRRGRALPEVGGAALDYQVRIPLFDRKQGRVRRIAFHAYKSVPSHPASSGCVRLKLADAKKLYQWTQIGTDVEIVRHRPDYLYR